jgi:5-methylcytosine-specific restriction endonuclease McrA
MSRPYIPESLRRIVAEQAMYRCGYCQTVQAISAIKLHVEHILPVSLGGQTVESNLWLACAMCNDYNVVLARKNWVRVGWHPPRQ